MCHSIIGIIAFLWKYPEQNSHNHSWKYFVVLISTGRLESCSLCSYSRVWLENHQRCLFSTMLLLQVLLISGWSLEVMKWVLEDSSQKAVQQTRQSAGLRWHWQTDSHYQQLRFGMLKGDKTTRHTLWIKINELQMISVFRERMFFFLQKSKWCIVENLNQYVGWN